MKKPKQIKTAYVFYSENYSNHRQDAPQLQLIVDRLERDKLSCDILLRPIAGAFNHATMISIHPKNGGPAYTLKGTKKSSALVGIKAFAKRCQSGEKIIE